MTHFKRVSRSGGWFGLRSLWVLRGAAVAGLSLLCAAGPALSAGSAQNPPPAAVPRWSQTTEPSFHHLMQDQGLPHEIATAVVEDGQGFIWVGTLGGLARWDGYRFRVFKADPRTPGALPDNIIQTLHSDAAGRLWVGTSAAGLVRYDAAEERFVQVAAGPQGLSHVSVRGLADDGQGGLWVATEAGLDRLDPASGRVQRADSQRTAALPAGRPVLAVLRERDGSLWVGTDIGLFRRERGQDHFSAVPLLAALPGTLAPQPGSPEPAVQNLVQDSSGRLWVGSKQHGAFVVSLGAGNRPPSAQALSTPALALAQQQVTGILEAQRGEIWLGTVGQGIVVVDVASGHTRRIRHRPTLVPSLSDNAVRDLYRDRAGLVWVATNRGVNRHDPRQSAILTMFGTPGTQPGTPAGDEAAERSSTEISSILPRPDGGLWLATHKTGIGMLDAAGRPSGALRPDASKPETALPQDIVVALEPAADDSVYAATKRGLYRVAADGRSVRRLGWAGREPQASTWAVLAQGSALWVGGQNDGVWRLDPAAQRATRLWYEGGHTLTDQRITTLAPAGEGRLWVGTRYGLNRVDPAGGPVLRLVPEPASETGLSAGFITMVYTDRRGRAWVGTYGGGINILEDLDAGGKPRFRRLGVAQGLPDDNVNALVEDAQGQVWASTDNGLAVIDPVTLQVRALRRAEGVQFATYWTNSAARTAQGELLFGAAGGMTVVRPERLQAWTYRPPLLVTSLRVAGREQAAGRFLTPGPAGEGRAEPPLLRVPPDGNSLAVEFAAADYSAPERNRYAYRLIGYSQTWVETDATQRLASYTNLPPGRYTLELRGSNRDGSWTEPPLALAVEVAAAWHQTWWFRSALVLALLLLMAAVLRSRTRLLRLRQAELEAKVQQRTAELHQVSVALEEKSRVLERSSQADPLTGLHNRRYLTARIDGEVAAAAARGSAAVPGQFDHVFLVIDIDHFKQVNDAHGHAAGDAVLVQFGQRLRAVLGDTDTLVRWGGEEFLAVVRQCSLAQACALADALRAAVLASDFKLDDGRPQWLTCSIGFAGMPFGTGPGPAPALGWQEVLKLADLALLAAKRSGRNAWVGLHGGPDALPSDLMQRVQNEPQHLLALGLLQLRSSQPLAEVARAWPPAPVATVGAQGARSR